MREFLCKYGLIIFLVVVVSVLAYQKEVIQTVPNQHVVINALTPVGPLPLIITKGLLNPENENKTWVTLKNFNKRMELLKNKRPKVDNKNTFEANK